MIRLLSQREAPSYMRYQMALMWERRWTRMLSVTCAIVLLYRWSNQRSMSHGVERVVRHFWPICSSRTPGSTVCDDLIVTCCDLLSVSSV